MDQRIESFLGDVLAFAGEEPDAVREGSPPMKDKAAHVCRALRRARVAEELQRRMGTRIGEHLKLVLSVIDRQVQ